MSLPPTDARTVLEYSIRNLPDAPVITATIDRNAAAVRDWYARQDLDVDDPITAHAILAGLAVGIGHDDNALLGVLVASHLAALTDHRTQERHR